MEVGMGWRMVLPLKAHRGVGATRHNVEDLYDLFIAGGRLLASKDDRIEGGL